jgi:hypothetical protein
MTYNYEINNRRGDGKIREIYNDYLRNLQIVIVIFKINEKSKWKYKMVETG